MLHWYSKLTVVALVAFAVSSAVGSFGAFGFHW